MNKSYIVPCLFIGYIVERYFLYKLEFFDSFIAVALFFVFTSVMAYVTEDEVSSFFVSLGTFAPLGVFLGFIYSNAVETHARWQAFSVVFLLVSIVIAGFFAMQTSPQEDTDTMELDNDCSGKCSRCGALNDRSADCCKFCHERLSSELNVSDDNDIQVMEQSSQNGSFASSSADIISSLEKLAELKEKGFLTDEEFEKSKSKILS